MLTADATSKAWVEAQNLARAADEVEKWNRELLAMFATAQLTRPEIRLSTAIFRLTSRALQLLFPNKTRLARLERVRASRR